MQYAVSYTHTIFGMSKNIESDAVHNLDENFCIIQYLICFRKDVLDEIVFFSPQNYSLISLLKLLML